MDTKTKRRLGIAVGVGLITLGSIFLFRRKAGAVVPPPPPPPPPPPGYANLYGVVTDASTGGPLAGAQTSIGILGTEFGGTQATSINPSDSSGYYLITDCGITGSMITLPGTYNVLFRKSGYQSLLVTGVNLVEGQNTTVNAQLSPIVQPELHIPGGALIGLNGQPLSEVGRLKEALTYWEHHSFLTLDDLWAHIVENHPEPSPPWTCPYCGVIFGTTFPPIIWDFYTHIVEQHLPPPPPYTCPVCGATGFEVPGATIPQYTPYAKMATPLVSQYLTDLIINIIDRTFSVEGYSCSYIIMRMQFLPTTPGSAPGLFYPGGGSVSVPPPSGLPANLDITLSTGSPYVPDLAGESGKTYDVWIQLEASLGGDPLAGTMIPAGSAALYLRNAIQCP